VSPPTIHHFGPDAAGIGGMETVIRVLAEHHVGGDIVMAHPTWRPQSRFASIPLALSAALKIPRLRRSDVVHVHLAEDGAFIREGALLVLARWLGKVTVVTIHGSSFLPFARKYGWLASGVLRRANLITCLVNAIGIPSARDASICSTNTLGNQRAPEDT
jgi:hypothetical protein